MIEEMRREAEERVKIPPYPSDLTTLASRKKLYVSPDVVWGYGAHAWSNETWEKFIFGKQNSRPSSLTLEAIDGYLPILKMLPSEQGKRCEYIGKIQEVVDLFELELPTDSAEEIETEKALVCAVGQDGDPVVVDRRPVQPEAARRAIECANHIRPLWEEFQTFKDDGVFKEVGFSSAYPYSKWVSRVEALREKMEDPALSDRERIRQNPCGRPDVKEVPGVPDFLTSSPMPFDLRQAAGGFYGRSSYAKEIGLQRYQEIDAFLDWASDLE